MNIYKRKNLAINGGDKLIKKPFKNIIHLEMKK